MTKPLNVIATGLGFYGVLREVGDKFEIRSEQELGKWMRRADRKEHLVIPVASAAQDGGESQDGAQYSAKHVGAGHWNVVGPDGEQVGETFKRNDDDKGQAQREATAEAYRLNAAAQGAPVGVIDASAAQDGGESQDGAQDLPDA